MMQIDYVMISCKEDVHIYCTNFAKKMERNSHETTSQWYMYGNDCFPKTFKFEMTLQHTFKNNTTIKSTEAHG
jgi:hypothetical protein